MNKPFQKSRFSHTAPSQCQSRAGAGLNGLNEPFTHALRSELNPDLEVAHG